MRILLINSSFNRIPFDENKGAESIVTATMALLRRRFGDDLRVSTTMVHSHRYRCPEGLMSVRNGPASSFRHVTWWSCAALVGMRWRAGLWRTLKKHLHVDARILVSGSIARSFAESDIVVHLGMDQYTDNAGFAHFLSHCAEIETALAMGKPVVMLAETVGPFRGTRAKRMAAALLKRVTRVSLREAESLKRLEQLGVPTTNMHLTACPAFTLPPTPLANVTAALKREGAEKKPGEVVIGYTPSFTTVMHDREESLGVPLQRILSLPLSLLGALPEGVTVLTSRMLWNSNLPVGRRRRMTIDNYVRSTDEYITELLKQAPDATMWIIPYIYSRSALSDVDLAARIYAGLHDDLKPRVRLIKEWYSAGEAKGIIGQCDVFMGDKLHACIAALSQCVPTIGMGYHYKVRAVFETLGVGDMVLKTFDRQTAVALACKALAERASIRAKLERSLPATLQLANREFDLLSGEGSPAGAQPR